MSFYGSSRHRTGIDCPCGHEDARHSRHLGCFTAGCDCKDTTRSIAPETPAEEAWRLATIADEAMDAHDKSLGRLRASLTKRGG